MLSRIKLKFTVGSDDVYDKLAEPNAALDRSNQCVLNTCNFVIFKYYGQFSVYAPALSEYCRSPERHQHEDPNSYAWYTR